MANKDVLEDKIFTKTAFAVRIDQLEAGIKWERSQREVKDKQLQELAAQLQKTSVILSTLTSVSEADARQFWDTLLKYLPKDLMEKLASLAEGGKPSKTFVQGLVQALRVYGALRVGDSKNGKKEKD